MNRFIEGIDRGIVTLNNLRVKFENYTKYVCWFSAVLIRD